MKLAGAIGKYRRPTTATVAPVTPGRITNASGGYVLNSTGGYVLNGGS